MKKWHIRLNAIWEYWKIKNIDVMQATFNPRELGAVRLHLVPPRVKLFHKIAPALIFINGNYILPIEPWQTILIANFMEELEQFDGRTIQAGDIQWILSSTVQRTKRIYYKTDEKQIAIDLGNLIEDFTNLAHNKPLQLKYPIISLSEYAKYMTGPHRMDLMVSSMTDQNGNWHCNNKCLHCYAAGQEHATTKELSTDEWKGILRKLYDARICQVTFTGGEPTLRDDLPELIRYARYFISRVNTNGIRLTKEYCQQLMDAELDNLQVTLYSADEKVHNLLVGNHSFSATVQGIKNAVEAGLSVSINTPLCTLNSDYVSTLQFIKELGVNYVTCSSIITTGNALNDASQRTQLSEEELVSILQKATKYCEEADMELSFTSPGCVSAEKLKEMHLTVPSCGACLSNMAITPDGKVVPCQSWLSQKELGDIQTESWESIWNSQRCEEIREHSSKLDGDCPLKQGGC